jgi:hypothetical protein
MSSPTRLDAIVTQNSILRQLFRQAATHRKLDLHIKHLLEEPLRGHIQLAVIRKDTLILTADSSAWAAKLRYQVPELRRQIAENSAFPDIQTIRVTVAKSDASRQRVKYAPLRPLTKATATELNRQAEALEDPALREALLRLADRQKR